MGVFLLQNEWLNELAFKVNVFNHSDFDRSKINARWNTVGTIAYVLIAVAATAGIIYTHLDAEHYTFSCVSESQGMAANAYHIGMCECTDTTDLQVELDMAGAQARCASTWSIPKCMSETSLIWYVGTANITSPFRGSMLKEGWSTACAVAMYSCLYGTCFQTGEYATLLGFGSGGTSSASPSTLHDMSEVRTFDAATDAIKCCGFLEEGNFSQALRVLGNIGGALGLITLALSIILSKCINNDTEARHETAVDPLESGGPPEQNKSVEIVGMEVQSVGINHICE